VPLKKKKYT